MAAHDRVAAPRGGRRVAARRRGTGGSDRARPGDCSGRGAVSGARRGRARAGGGGGPPRAGRTPTQSGCGVRVRERGLGSPRCFRIRDHRVVAAAIRARRQARRPRRACRIAGERRALGSRSGAAGPDPRSEGGLLVGARRPGAVGGGRGDPGPRRGGRRLSRSESRDGCHLPGGDDAGSRRRRARRRRSRCGPARARSGPAAPRAPLGIDHAGFRVHGRRAGHPRHDPRAIVARREPGSEPGRGPLGGRGQSAWSTAPTGTQSRRSRPESRGRHPAARGVGAEHSRLRGRHPASVIRSQSGGGARGRGGHGAGIAGGSRCKVARRASPHRRGHPAGNRAERGPWPPHCGDPRRSGELRRDSTGLRAREVHVSRCARGTAVAGRGESGRDRRPRRSGPGAGGDRKPDGGSF